MNRWLGRMLRDVHAGESRLAWHHPVVATAPEILRIGSPAFAPGGWIPRRHAGKGVGDDLSPALEWSAAPAGTVALVLLMEDPDAPLPRPFVHLIAHGLPAASRGVPEGALTTANAALRFGRNTFGGAGYGGPRALPAHGPHRYWFELLAISRSLAFHRPPSLGALLSALDGAVLARGRFHGIFEQA